jgi:hypothetical protein
MRSLLLLAFAINCGVSAAAQYAQPYIDFEVYSGKNSVVCVVCEKLGVVQSQVLVQQNLGCTQMGSARILQFMSVPYNTAADFKGWIDASMTCQTRSEQEYTKACQATKAIKADLSLTYVDCAGNAPLTASVEDAALVQKQTCSVLKGCREAVASMLSDYAIKTAATDVDPGAGVKMKPKAVIQSEVDSFIAGQGCQP